MRYGYEMGAGMWVVWILLLALIALVVYLVVRAGDGGRSSSGDGGRSSSGDAPQRPIGRAAAVDILNARYARGEISSEEYEERLGHLAGG